jgi:hypothetical protein
MTVRRNIPAGVCERRIRTIEQILTIFSLPITGWTVAAFVLLFFLRNRIGKWIDHVLDGIGATVGGAWSYRRFMRRYNALIREKHQTIKLVGIRTEQERRPLIEKAYVPLKLRPWQGTIESYISIEQIVQEAPYSIILGDPGAGKSTLLEYLVQLFTKPATTRSWLSVVPYPFSRVSARTRLPFYVPLRRCLARNKTLLDDILDPETRILPEAVRQQMPKKFVERCMKRKDALLLLDGLDEVADKDAYKAVIGKVNDFRELFPGNTVVVTCRMAGWRAALEPEANVFLTLPLDSQQQSDFVRKWYAAILRDAAFRTGAEDSEISGKADREADHLLNLLSARERLRELASNPLLLALVCLLHRQKKNLPRGRADLYQDCIDILLFQWDQADNDLNQTTPPSEQKKELLRRVAYKMHTDGDREIKREALERLVVDLYPEILSGECNASRLIRQIEVRSGLVVERSIDQLAFSHLTFQEFLVVDYLRTHPGYDITKVTLSDQRWREPLLLMCGLEKRPHSLIATVFETDPILALYGIAEADPTLLDLKAAGRLIDQCIERVFAESLKFADAVPAIVGLVSIQKNPFEHKIVEFIYKLIKNDPTRGISQIIETLSNTQTRATARILLSLLREPELVEQADLIITGLARMGDPAVYEAVDAAREIEEVHLFQLLSLCESRAATEVLWLRYGVNPPREWQLLWARAWARRLANRDADATLRREQSSLVGLCDEITWPYKRNDASAAVVCKVVQILRDHYKDSWQIAKDIDAVATYSLRVQIPLLVAKAPAFAEAETGEEGLLKHWGLPAMPEGPDRMERIRERVFTALDVPGSFGYTVGAPLPDFFNAHWWLTLRGFLTQKPTGKVLKTLARIVGVCGLLSVAVLSSLGIRALLPPDGTYGSLWSWLPLWLQIGAPSLVLILCVWVSAHVVKSFTEGLFNVLLMFLIICAVIVSPFLALLYRFFPDAPRRMEEFVSTGQVNWAGVAYCCVIAVVAAWLIVIAGHLAVSSFHIGMSVTIVTALILAAMLCYARGSAFRYNGIAEWLLKHPRGAEVFHEFESLKSPGGG